jgi:thioredoxin-like negative regulator of GroEL
MKLAAIRNPTPPLAHQTAIVEPPSGASSVRGAYAAALALADVGQNDAAIDLLRQHCRLQPEDIPARELLSILEP